MIKIDTKNKKSLVYIVGLLLFVCIAVYWLHSKLCNNGAGIDQAREQLGNTGQQLQEADAGI